MRSLTAKLFVAMFATGAALLLLLSYWSIRRTSELWTESLREHATQTGAVIERALRYAMLSSRKDELHVALRDIAREPTVQALRIYDKNGRILFSSEPDEIGRRVRQTAEACVPCHDGRKHKQPDPDELSRLLQDEVGNEVLARFQPIRNEAQCSTARCHVHSEARTILGVLDLRMSVDAIRDHQMSAQYTVLGGGALLAVASAIASGWFVQRFVRKPVNRLASAAKQVAAGDLDAQVLVSGRGELADFARTFNTMILDLRRARERATQWGEELERAVDEATTRLRQAQQHAFRMEKMASLGKLSATVAHELNNPLAGILVYTKLVQRELGTGELTAESQAELVRCLDVIQRECTRCGEIVNGLLTFARESRSTFAPARLTEIVDRSVMTVRHLVEGARVTIDVALHQDDAIVCDANQIQQALVALLVNAIEAMPNGGPIVIRSRGEADRVSIEVSDVGGGIPSELLPSIFEPFVTTKSDAKGVGLGLPVVWGIAKRHGGSVEVDSELGRGSSFRVVLPRQAHATPSDHEAH